MGLPTGNIRRRGRTGIKCPRSCTKLGLNLVRQLLQNVRGTQCVVVRRRCQTFKERINYQHHLLSCLMYIELSIKRALQALTKKSRPLSEYLPHMLGYAWLDWTLERESFSNVHEITFHLDFNWLHISSKWKRTYHQVGTMSKGARVKAQAPLRR